MVDDPPDEASAGLIGQTFLTMPPGYLYVLPFTRVSIPAGSLGYSGVVTNDWDDAQTAYSYSCGIGSTSCSFLHRFNTVCLPFTVILTASTHHTASWVVVHLSTESAGDIGCLPAPPPQLACESGYHPMEGPLAVGDRIIDDFDHVLWLFCTPIQAQRAFPVVGLGSRCAGEHLVINADPFGNEPAPLWEGDAIVCE